MVSERDFYPPKEVRKAAQAGVDWISKGYAEVDRETLQEAKSLARGEKQKTGKLRKMRKWFSANHDIEKSDGLSQPNEAQVLDALWGGSTANSWSNDVMRKLERS